MGINEFDLNLARRIALYNSEVIYYVKNSLMQMTPKIQKTLSENHEKFVIIINDNYRDINHSLILANYSNNENHDITKLDVDLIYDVLNEAVHINEK